MSLFTCGHKSPVWWFERVGGGRGWEVGGGGRGSLPASQQRGTHAWHNQRHRGMTHSWFDWAVALIAHVSAISAQGAAAHMLTMLIQGKLIGTFQIHSQSNAESRCSLCEMGTDVLTRIA